MHSLNIIMVVVRIHVSITMTILSEKCRLYLGVTIRESVLEEGATNDHILGDVNINTS